MAMLARTRRAVGLVVLSGAVVLASGCSSGSNSGAARPPATAATTTSPEITTDSTRAAPVPTAVATTAAAVTTAAATAAADPAATLQHALDERGASYHFSTTASVNGAVALVADGDRIGDGSRFTLTANGTSVEYVITADGTWVQRDGATWQQLDDPPATADPIASLRAPSAVTVDGADGSTTRLAVTVPATSLGLPGDGGVTVQATVVAGALAGVAYTATVNGTPAAVTSTFGPPTDPAPVTSPSA